MPGRLPDLLRDSPVAAESESRKTSSDKRKPDSPPNSACTRESARLSSNDSRRAESTNSSVSLIASSAANKRALCSSNSFTACLLAASVSSLALDTFASASNVSAALALSASAMVSWAQLNISDSSSDIPRYTATPSLSASDRACANAPSLAFAASCAFPNASTALLPAARTAPSSSVLETRAVASSSVCARADADSVSEPASAAPSARMMTSVLLCACASCSCPSLSCAL
mmetsp:Transcript_12511/g.31691  ORF Transcript_12511/g.31691 Transcript_12511/m.31691 type:complete len:231 (-) Transcript_12511:658-1350(-)